MNKYLIVKTTMQKIIMIKINMNGVIMALKIG